MKVALTSYFDTWMWNSSVVYDIKWVDFDFNIHSTYDKDIRS